jgi:predicted Zn-dependent protease
VEACSKTFRLRGTCIGGCGKAGQFPVYCGMGGPEVLVKEVSIGGN